MNKIKTLLLGTAALAVAATGVQAADPIFEDVKDPREPVYRCDITGFIELPGTDICFKVGGYMRLVTTVASDRIGGTQFFPGVGTIIPWAGDFPSSKNQADRFMMYGQARLNFDARTETEYGTVRGFAEIQASDSQARTGGAVALRHAFVQFGNWTFGKTWSTFNHLASSAPGSDPYVRVGDSFIRRNQIRYTQPFGPGFSLSVAIEDPAYNYGQAAGAGTGVPLDTSGKVWTNPISLTQGVKDRGYLPDVVANINVSGDWGSAQVAGAAHQNRIRSAVNPGFTDSEWGWAAMFGLALNVPTGEGDVLGFKATYTDGASQYMQDLHPGNVNTVWGNNSLAVGVLQPDQILSTVRTWSVLGHFTHNLTPTFRASIGAGYGETDFRGSVAFLPPVIPVVGSGAFNPFVNQRRDLLEVFAVLEWNPVPRTSFMIDVNYGHADYKGDTPINPLTGARASSTGSAWTGTFQVTRSF